MRVPSLCDLCSLLAGGYRFRDWILVVNAPARPMSVCRRDSYVWFEEMGVGMFLWTFLNLGFVSGSLCGGLNFCRFIVVSRKKIFFVMSEGRCDV